MQIIPVNEFVQVEEIKVKSDSPLIVPEKEVSRHFKLISVSQNEQGLKKGMEVLIDPRYVQQIDTFYFTKQENIYAIVG